ncbi:MAG: hypothetical protein ABI416_10320 [Ginsengibacter sp.]
MRTGKIIEITLPAGRQVCEGETTTYWFENNGILVSLSKSPRSTVANISANIALLKHIANNK